MKYLIFDLGSNTIKSSLYEKKGYFQSLNHTEKFLNLWKYYQNNHLNKFGEKLLFTYINDEKIKHIKSHNDLNIFAYATEFFRKFNNKEEFVKRFYANTNLHLDIISSNTEAKLIYNAFLNQNHLQTNKSYYFCDLGGGSLEIAKVLNNTIDLHSNNKIGVRSLFLSSVNNKDSYIESEINHIIKTFFKLSINKKSCFLATGGSFISLLHINEYFYKHFKKAITFKELECIYLFTKKFLINDYKIFPKLSPLRYDIICFAIIIYYYLMKNFQIEKIKLIDDPLSVGYLKFLNK